MPARCPPRHASRGSCLPVYASLLLPLAGESLGSGSVHPAEPALCPRAGLVWGKKKRHRSLVLCILFFPPSLFLPKTPITQPGGKGGALMGTCPISVPVPRGRDRERDKEEGRTDRPTASIRAGPAPRIHCPRRTPSVCAARNEPMPLAMQMHDICLAPSRHSKMARRTKVRDEPSLHCYLSSICRQPSLCRRPSIHPSLSQRARWTTWAPFSITAAPRIRQPLNP